MTNQHQKKQICATLAMAALLGAPAYSKGWSSMEDQRGYLSQDESVAVLARQQPQSSESVVAVAEAFKGLPYVWAGTRADQGFDCSGFVYEVMRLNGYTVPRMADHQFEQSRRVKKKDLKRGDMVFFSTYLPGPSHVGIYLGEGEFIHASSAAEGVVVSQLGDGYYGERFLAGGRPDGWNSDSTESPGPVVNLVTDSEVEPKGESSEQPGRMKIYDLSPKSTDFEWIADRSDDRRDPFSKESSTSNEADAVPFDAPVESKAEEAGLKLQLQLGEMVAVGRLWASDFLGRLTDGVAALSPLSPEGES